MHPQLNLALSLKDEATFDNFLAPADSVRAQACGALLNPGGENLIYLWGSADSGRCHLLQAACHHQLHNNSAAQYLPLAEIAGLDPQALLASLDELPLVCLEGLEAVADNLGWEKALFNLFNGIKARGGLLVVTANCAPRDLPLGLPDLKSRLASGLTYHLRAYTDSEKLAIVRFRAGRLGLDMSEEAAGFILNRGERGLEDLLARLRQLDVASLRAQRRVTIPFIKALFHW
jgi:DnaA family protein